MDSLSGRALRGPVSVAVLDPSMMPDQNHTPPNTGDQIIARAVMREVRSALPGAVVSRFPTHDRLTEAELDGISSSDYIIVGGSNLLGNPQLSRRTLRYWKQWDITERDASRIGRAILLGVGWRVYEDRVTHRSKRLISKVLANSESGRIHSVRDGYTAIKLASVGVSNVVNTSCPTLWPLAGSGSAHISRERSDTVLTTVTDYRRDVSSDAELQKLLMSEYARVFVWPQGANDLEYLRELGTQDRTGGRLEILGPSLLELDGFLAETHCDYVGTRLHCGIHCMNAGKRSLVLGVDNRATEIASDLHLPVVRRDNLLEVARWIANPAATELRINQEAIGTWRGQFQGD